MARRPRSSDSSTDSEDDHVPYQRAPPHVPDVKQLLGLVLRASDAPHSPVPREEA